MEKSLKKSRNWDEIFALDKIRKRWEYRKEESKNAQTPEEIIDELKKKLIVKYNKKGKDVFDSLLAELKALFEDWERDKKNNDKRWIVLELIQQIEELIIAFEIEKKF